MSFEIAFKHTVLIGLDRTCLSESFFLRFPPSGCLWPGNKEDGCDCAYRSPTNDGSPQIKDEFRQPGGRWAGNPS